MYSSNQHLDISCDYKQFSSVLDFVIRLSGVHECLTREERRVKPAFRITEDGLYLLKLGSMPADKKGLPQAHEFIRGLGKLIRENKRDFSLDTFV